MTAFAWAISYGVVVTAGLWAVVRKKLPHHPWHYGKFSPVIFLIAVLWSVVLCIALVASDPLTVGLGMAGVLAAGFLIYFLIPKARRANIPGVTVDHAAED